MTNRNKETTTPGRRDYGTKQRSDTKKRRNDESNMLSTICLHRSREQLGLSVRKRNVMLSFEWLRLSVHKKKKIVIRSNGSGCPLEKIVARSIRKARAINSCWEKKVLKIGHKSVQNIFLKICMECYQYLLNYKFFIFWISTGHDQKAHFVMSSLVTSQK